MNKILDYKTGKVVEIVLDRGEQEYLCRYNLRAIEAQNKEAEQLKEYINYAREEDSDTGC